MIYLDTSVALAHLLDVVALEHGEPRARLVPLEAAVHLRVVVEHDENDRKIIWNALSDCTSDHAFQQELGLGSDMIFDINDPALRARITQRLIQIFRDFEAQNRYKLKQSTLKWGDNPAEQELVLEFMYLNIESDEELTFKRVFTKAS